MANQNNNIVEYITPNPESPPSSPASPPPPNPQTNCNHCIDCCSVQFMNEIHASFSSSAAPTRLMYYQNGTWLDFSIPVLHNARSSFLERNPVIEVSMDGEIYSLDFLHMLQTDAETKNKRSIAWIDENGKCFFPNMFVDAQSEGCASMPEKNDGTKQQRLVTSDAESSNSRWANARKLREHERAFALVRDCFMVGIQTMHSGAIITAIHQYKGEGPLEKARHDVFQKQIVLTKAARGVGNTVLAWYGASVKAVESVLEYGFGVPNKVSGPDSYGVGVHLSPLGLPFLSAQLADADDNNEKHIILCRIILGALEKVEAGSTQSHPSSEEFDNGVDDPNNPKWYVVWSTNMNRHILPECIVSFKSSNPLQGPEE